MRCSILIALTVLKLVLADNDWEDWDYSGSDDEDTEDDDSYSLPEEFVNDVISDLLKKLKEGTLLGVVMDGYKDGNVSSDCYKSLSNLSEALDQGDLNAAKFVDATGKIQAGLALGSLTSFGSFDQCIDIDFPDGVNSMFRGQYCSVIFPIDFDEITTMIEIDDRIKNASINTARSDICLPSTCTKGDLEAALRNGFAKLLMGMVELDLKVGVCQTREIFKLTLEQKVAFVIFGVLGIFLIIGTLVDVIPRLRKLLIRTSDEKLIISDGKVRSAILSFSLYTNVKKLLNTETNSDNLGALHGVRFFTTTWIIFFHTYYLMNLPLSGNLRKLGDKPSEFLFQIAANGTISTDSFFMMSGLLVTYTTLKALGRKGKFNLAMHYFHRYWRLTWPYAAVVLFTLIFPLLGSGPTWKDETEITSLFRNCKNNWWASLLYVNNFYEPNNMCLLHGWYLTADMQFYIVSPIIIMAIYKTPVYGLILNFVLMVSTTVATGLITFKNEYKALANMKEDVDGYFADVYVKPYCRMGPYCVGIFVGYFLTVKTKINLSRVTKILLWCLAVICNMSVLFGTQEWNKGNLSRMEIHALYEATFRTAWALGLAWLVLACATNNGGIVNMFLSWKPFLVLGRMCYFAYLTHPLAIAAYSGMIRERVFYTNYAHVIHFLGLLTLVFLISFLGCLSTEIPFLELEKVLFPKRRPQIIIKDSTRPNGTSNGVDNKALDSNL